VRDYPVERRLVSACFPTAAFSAEFCSLFTDSSHVLVLFSFVLRLVCLSPVVPFLLFHGSFSCFD